MKMINAEARKIMAQINKKMGSDVVVMGADIRHDLISRFSSGSVTYDYILGGGFPANQWHELRGEPSHGKTAIALKTIAANQATNPDFTTVWVAAEQWVPEYAEMCGVDVSRMIVIETNIMEDAYDAVLAFAESKSVDCIVIDSLPSLVPSTEDEKTMEEATVGRGALLTNKFFRKAGAAMKRSLTEAERPILGIVINQWRQSIGVMYGDNRTTPGGKGKDYAYFTITEVRRKDWIKVGSGENESKVGQQIVLKTTKNKSAPPYQTAAVDFYFKEHSIYSPGDFDVAKEVVAMAVINNVVERKGGWIYHKEQKWQGLEAFANSVREDVGLYEELRKVVLDSRITFLEGDSDE
jgi:recombination protein RecA